MNATKLFYAGIVALAILFSAAWPVRLGGGQPEAVQIDADDIGGVVAGANGPEAGV